MKKKRSKFYAVFHGRRTGVFNWGNCKKQVEHYANARYQGYPSLEMAKAAFESDQKSSARPVPTATLLTKLGERPPMDAFLVVDGSCNIFKESFFRGIVFPEKKQVFVCGPQKPSTNNIAEFLAIVEALKYCKLHGLDLVIYSDCLTALAWLGRKRANTRLAYSKETAATFTHIREAEKWLRENTYSNKVKKWQTRKWGENPADFGLKF